MHSLLTRVPWFAKDSIISSLQLHIMTSYCRKWSPHSTTPRWIRQQNVLKSIANRCTVIYSWRFLLPLLLTIIYWCLKCQCYRGSYQCLLSVLWLSVANQIDTCIQRCFRSLYAKRWSEQINKIIHPVYTDQSKLMSPRHYQYWVMWLNHAPSTLRHRVVK